MPKRKKSWADDGFESKRKKFDLTEQLQELLDLLKTYKTSEGKQICETFIRAPKRRSLAEYYEVVTTPIDLLRIQQKIRMDEYDDIEQFNSDIELLVNNTKSYFKPDSVEYADAVKLWDVYLDLKNQVFGQSRSPSTSSVAGSKNDSADESATNAAGSTASESDSNENQFEELFGAVMSATSHEDGRQLSAMFEFLPSRSIYPDYYEIVTEPIDLKTIAYRIQHNEYGSLNELEKDLFLMIRNAKTYNAPGSQIYKDANAIKRIIQQKRSEIDAKRSTPASKSSERIRAKRQTPFQNKWPSIAAALKYEDHSSNQLTDEFDEATNDDVTVNFSDSEQDHLEQSNNAQWLLFSAVNDTPHSDPFIRLPSKRFYPDYYKEIKHPISLSQIGSRIMNNYYEKTSDLVEELTLVFDNAMNYNRPDSKIYKDAAKLKKILQMKAREIISAFKDGADDDDDDDGDDDDQNTEHDVNLIPSPTKKNTSGQRTTRSSKRSMVNAMSQELKNVRRSQKANNSQQKTRMMALYRHLLDYEEDGRYLINPFMEKPSRKMYPDYYDIIANPIDMKTIENKIKNGLYESEKSLVNDFRLMFSNCREYNEDNSLIYQDADQLEAEMDAKLQQMGPLPITDQHRTKKERVRPSSGTQLKIKTLYETVRDYVDNKGRLLSSIFLKLPSRADFPDYYEVIAKPICLEKIGSRVKNFVYETVEDLLSDIILMLDNACKYNEPDSQIFKDALTLQQVALQTKIELNEDSVNGIPDVKIIVQDLLTNLFISVYNHQDEEGRCFSDSINELSELSTSNDSAELKTLNFDIIKRNLNLGRYRRMDRFQQDMFDVLERARKISRTDSQAFEDSIELQSYFITLRNELCRNGELLQSTALDYNLDTLNTHIEALRREKVPKEISEEESARNVEEKDHFHDHFNSSSNQTQMTIQNDDEVVFHQDLMLKIGDFVYVEPHDKNLEPHIIYIENFKKDAQGQTLVHGCWFYRPYETYHLASRKFLEKEVFKSDNYTTTPLSQVIGKCCVMFVKDYFRNQPVAIDEKDVYVCESRYSSKGKSFKKIKIWPCLQNTPLVMRSNLLPMNRVPSVFAKNRSEQSTTATETLLKAENEDIDNELLEQTNDNADVSVLDVQRINVMCDAPDGIMAIDGAQYYEQFTIPAGTFRVGDCCYVRTDQERNLICRIDRMWVDTDGNPYFHGPWYVQQAELPPNTVGSFYPQEVFLSSIEDTNPLLSICERCCVLDLADYCSQRPTEFLEKDVYVCEIRYLEHEKKFEPLLEGGLRKFVYQSYSVVRNEVYFFRQPLMLSKPSYELPQVMEDASTIYQKLPDATQLNISMTAGQQSTDSMARLTEDDSTNDTITGLSATVLSSGTPHNAPMMAMVGSTDQNGQQAVTSASLVGTNNHTPASVAVNANNGTPSGTASSSTSKKKPSKRLVTGYIIFASEVRRSVVEANPDCSFGDISRIIGNQWKVLTPEQKNEFEQRAAKQNQEVKEQVAAEKALQDSLNPHPSSPAVSVPIENGVYECHWANQCDYQFEDVQDLFEHLTAEPNGHVWLSYANNINNEPGEFQCMFHGCGRVKKGAAPFPSIARLIRHCKEVHINKAVAKHVEPEKRSRNYVPSTKIAQTKVQPMVHTPAGPIIQSQQPQTQFQTINFPQNQITIQHQQGTVSTPISIMAGNSAQGQTIVTTHHAAHQPQIAVATGQSGQFIQHHQIIQGTAQTIQGMLHAQPTMVSSVPAQSQLQIQTPQIQIQTSNQNLPQKTSTGVQVKPADPIFITPPQPNRLLHTQAYMKYIENLKPDKPFISNWHQQLLSAGPNLTANNTTSTLSSWLENGPLNHGTIEKALWSLRNFMLKDSLNLAQNC